jgi:uncharacterized protein YecE (DUF72 family)
VGPAGWSYKDWEGIVYPATKPKSFDPVAYLADYFDTIEINSTFYRPPRPEVAKSWAHRVRNNPHFRFTAKLWRGFTHERNASPADEREFIDGIAPLAEAGRFGALLLQFPWSFRNTRDNRAYLLQLQQRFQDFPLVLEVRHATWNDEAALQMLSELGIGLCNIDQPLFSDSIHPAAHTTSPVGYVRLHGRNYKQWFTENARTGDRYNYLYSPAELEPWVARIKEVAKKTKETYAVTNNHLNGQATVNALEIASYLSGEPVRVPEDLASRYPRLNDIASKSTP